MTFATQAVEIRRRTASPKSRRGRSTGSTRRASRSSSSRCGVIVFLLQYMQAFLAPLAFGLLLFYALDPAVDAHGTHAGAAVDRALRLHLA